MRHPRVFIFGALESRLQSVDLVVLGGMNEGTWPGQTANDPFLSRTMKTSIGLEPPERRIGQLAHDFQMACGTRKLILTRAMRKGATPTVASRWLQRLLAVGGQDFAARLRENGKDYQQWAGMLDQGVTQPLATAPGTKTFAGAAAAQLFLQRSRAACGAIPMPSMPAGSCGCSRSIRSTAIRVRPSAARSTTRSSSGSSAPSLDRRIAGSASGNEPDS